MLVGINELHAGATKIIRGLGRPDAAPVLVIRHHRELVAAIYPLGPDSAQSDASREVSMREFSRETTQVLARVRADNASLTLTNRGQPVGVVRPVTAADAIRYSAEMAAQSRAFIERLEHAEVDLATDEAKTLEEFQERLDNSSLEAVEAALVAINKPARPVGAGSLGQLLEQAGDAEGAEDAYRRADEAGSAPGACNLGALLEESGDLDGAEAAYRRADERGSRDGALNLARVLMQRGDVTAAEEAFHRAKDRQAHTATTGGPAGLC